MTILTEANRGKIKNRKKRPVPMAGPSGTRRVRTTFWAVVLRIDRRPQKLKNSAYYGQVGESIFMDVTFM